MAARDWKARVEPFIAPLSDALRTPDGTQTLRPAQAAILLEGAEQLGCFANGRVGIGKSLCVELLPVLLRGKLGRVRALQLCPGGILKASNEHAEEIAAHWQLPEAGECIRLSYTAVSRMPAKGESLFNLFGPCIPPNVVICDEADALRNQGGSALTRQLEELLTARPETVFIVVTGTCDVEGLCDYAHLMDWALRGRSPLPRDRERLEEWSSVIDRGELARAKVVCQDLGIEPTTDLTIIRAAFRRRVYGTPGVIIADDPYTGAELVVREHLLEAPGLDSYFERLRLLWQRPDGFDLLGGGVPDDEREPDRIEGSTIWGVARRMARGCCYVYDPRPPAEWLEARRGYASWVRSQITRGRFLTELQARQDAIARNLPSWLRWEDIAPTYVPVQKTLWLDDTALRWAEQWGRERPGVIWVEDVAFGVELSQRTGWPYFQGKGRSSCGRTIPSGRGRPSAETVIASRRACGTGLNLQYRWNRCLFVAPVNTSRDFEQSVGRFHREGLESWTDRCEVDILLGCSEDFQAVANVLRGAQRTAESLYAQKAASYEWPRIEKPLHGWAWQGKV